MKLTCNQLKHLDLQNWHKIDMQLEIQNTKLSNQLDLHNSKQLMEEQNLKHEEYDQQLIQLTKIYNYWIQTSKSIKIRIERRYNTQKLQDLLLEEGK